ncbi:MAG: FhaA domain-containing protein [Solirubrobacteraceae bacterium]
MSVLRSIESKIAGLVEGTFSRVFRSEVRPVEMARKLAREMDEHRTVALRATYVPNEYRVYLSPRDRERFAEYEDELITELVGYLLEHARNERLVLTAKPSVQFETDDRLRLGEFGIETRVTPHDQSEQSAAVGYDDRYDDEYESSPEAAPPEPGAPEGAPREPPAPVAASMPPRWEQEAVGRTMIHGASERVVEPLAATTRARHVTALLLVDGRRMVVGPAGATIGRSRQCDVVVDDPNISRKHAEVRPRGGAWVLRDLGSTNGTRLNGRRLDGPEVLRRGDEIQLGATRIAFELE